MKRTRVALALLAACGALSPASSFASAAGSKQEQRAALAAARSDAFLNLLEHIQGLSTGAVTLGRLMRSDPKVRASIEEVLRGAGLVGEPSFDPSGIVRVTLEAEMSGLPYDLRLRIRNLPKVVRADGVAGVEAAATTASVKVSGVTEKVLQWAEKTLEAEGTAALRGAAESAAAKKRARRKALRKALTALAEKVDALELDPGVRLSAYVARHPGMRPRVQATLVQADITSESLRAGKYTVQVALPGRALLKPLKLGGFRYAYAKHLTESQVESARKNARRSALARLKEKIGDLPANTGGKAAKIMERNPRIKAALDALLRRAVIDRVRVTEDGLVKMYVSVSKRDLPRDLYEQLAAETPDRIVAVGAGLPDKARRTRKSGGGK